MLLAAVFPWTPLIVQLFRKELYDTPRARFLLEWLVFGLLFFSLSENKLPGYLLPLLPPLAALLGLGLANVARASAGPLLGLSAALLWCIPIIADALPEALLNGASHVTLHPSPSLLILGLVTGVVIFSISNRGISFAVVSFGVVIGVLYLNFTAVPILDKTVSARDFWRTHQPITCIDEGTRSWRYGLNYYARRDVPDCYSMNFAGAAR